MKLSTRRRVTCHLPVLHTELKRSVAPWVGLVVLAVGLAFLYLINGPWWWGTERWTDQWTSMALWTRSLLAVIWPLAVGLGALQGLRDSRSRMNELLATAPRPGWHHAALSAGACALGLTAAFALLVAQGGAQILLGDTTYHHLGWLPVSLVAVLSLVAGALLGMGLGRALPSALTPPAMAVAALVFTVLLQQNSDGALPTSMAPQRVAMLSPVVAEVRASLLTLSAAVHLGQTLWLLGMLATGFLLLVAASVRARLLALAPLLAGAALALLVLPAEPRQTYVVDGAAASLVCEGQVCVTEAQRHRLAELAPRGRTALRHLRDALGAQAPTSIREETTLRGSLEQRALSRNSVLVNFNDPVLAHAKGAELTRVLVGEGLSPHCFARSARESGAQSELAAQSVAASWSLGSFALLAGSVHNEREHAELARPAYQKLKALPSVEQRTRIADLRAEAFACQRGGLEALSGGTSR